MPRLLEGQVGWLATQADSLAARRAEAMGLLDREEAISACASSMDAIEPSAARTSAEAPPRADEDPAR